MAKNLDSTSPPWWTLAQMLVWILQQVEMPPQYAEQLCNELNPKLIEEALDALTKALFNAICGAVGGMPIDIARVLCGHRYEDLAAFFQPLPSQPSALAALRQELRQFIEQPGIEFNPIWGKRTWPARVPAAQTVPTPTRPTESAVADKAEPIPGSAVGPKESQSPNKPDSVDAPPPAGPVRINVGGDPDIAYAIAHTIKRARPAYTADAPIVAENAESLSDSPARSSEAKAFGPDPAARAEEGMPSAVEPEPVPPAEPPRSESTPPRPEKPVSLGHMNSFSGVPTSPTK